MIKNKTILIIEDEKPLKKLLKNRLEKEGYEILEANNGKEGLKMILEDKPDLVLLDIVMPVMDGVTMIKKLRKEKKGKNVKIIILSNLSDEQKISEAIENNVFDYLVKSNWELEKVVDIINKKLS